MSAIKLANLWEKYRIKFVEAGKVSWEEIWALQDVNLDVLKGEVIGIIGQNGAGKTTFLRLIAGMLVPDKGEVKVNGKVSAIMELGAGLNPEFTGRENILLNARVYGINEENLEQKIEEIVIFSGLGKFISAPIKYYSQGMYMRLAFSLAVFAEPDILLIDDILAVGDQEAQGKCLKKITELKDAGKTIVIVSHDMGMINRLCGRVILFEKGKIIKHGLPQEVIPYYLETSGEKQGTAVLENGPLRVVFNNGRLSISCFGRQLTGTLGITTSFFDPLLKIQTCSANLSWKINSRTASEFVCEGFCRDDSLFSQTWIISLVNNDLSIRVSSNFSQKMNSLMDFFISSAYTGWKLFECGGNFPDFADKVRWFDLNVQLPPEQALGLSSKTDDSLCGLIIQTRGQVSSAKLFNSGYSQESRILQIASNEEELFLGVSFYPRIQDFNAYFLAEEEKIISCREKQKQEALLKEKLENEARVKKEEEKRQVYLSQHTIRRQEVRLFVDIHNRRLCIYYKDKELTASGGINSIFLLKDLDELCWNTQKVSDYRLILTLGFVNLTQIWDISLEEGNILCLKISGEAKADVSVDNRFLRLELSGTYQSWQTPAESGDFLNAQYAQLIAPVRLKDSRVYRLAALSRSKDQPKVSFEITSSQDKCVAGIFKQKTDTEEITCLSFYAIVPWAESIILAGKHDIFSGKITFGPLDMPQENNLSQSTASVCSTDTEFRFDRGRGKLYWKSSEITAGLGVYTAVRSQNVWYDSCQAVWSIIRKDNHSISLSGKWPYIPVSQLWQLELIAEDQWQWIVSMEIHKETVIELEQAGIMLISSYKSWSAGKEAKGEFQDDFTPDYDILPFRYWYGKADKDTLTACGKDLPRVSFLNTAAATMARGLVENSDFIYSSRLLQYQKSNEKTLPPKKYPYFSGVIEVGNKR